MKIKMAVHTLFTVTLTSLMIVTSLACPVRECSCEMGRNGVTVDCRNKNFDKIPEFQPGTEIYYELKLSGNQIAVIPGKAFKKLPVAKIDLSDNPVRKISPLAFEGLETKLKELVIEAKTDTPIKFPPQLLHSLAALESVKIKGFDMPVLEHGLFQHSSNLQRLTLENCKIITIFPTALQGLEDKLTLLDLSNNRLTKLPVQELETLVHLRKLVLAQNRITGIPHTGFRNLTKLIDLDLSQNSIQKIESSAFFGLEQSLEFLGLHANMLSQNSLLAIANLVHLEQLNLAYNLFVNNLPDYTFKNLNKLAYLNLQGNRLSSISAATFEGLGDSLRNLILSENKFTTLPDEGFRHLKNLKSLYLDLMKLGGTFTQHTFHGLENTLEYLTLEGVNFINDDLKSVHYLKALKTLNLCQNLVSELGDGTFSGLVNLEQLMLCHNQVKNLTQSSLQGLEKKLDTLNLEANMIETVDQCTLKDFNALKQLNLDSNPLNCDCRLKWLRQWIENQNDISKMMIGWQCSKPKAHADRLLKHVSVEDLTCSEHVTITCQEMVKAKTEQPHAHIKETSVGEESVSLVWEIDNQNSVIGVRLFYKMTDNETYTYTLLLNPSLRQYIIHDLYPETNYTICIGLDLKLGEHLPDEECITVTTDKYGTGEAIPPSDPENNTGFMMIIAASVGGLIFLLLLLVVTYYICKWRRHTHRAKHGLYDTPSVTSRPQAPSLSTLPSRRSDFENPMRHYYSRPLSTGTLRTVSSHLARSNSAGTVLDGPEAYDYRPSSTEYRRSGQEHGLDYGKRARSVEGMYDMDRCLYKIDKMMVSASNLLQPDIPPPYPGAMQSGGPYPGATSPVGPYPDARQTNVYPAQVSDYPHCTISRDASRDVPRDLTIVDDSMRDSGHMSGFPSYTSGFEEDLRDHPRDQSRDQGRHVEDPLPPPPAYMLEDETPTEDRIYDEIYTIY